MKEAEDEVEIDGKRWRERKTFLQRSMISGSCEALSLRKTEVSTVGISIVGGTIKQWSW